MQKSAKKLLGKLYYLFVSKHDAELRYWKRCYRKEGYALENGFYRKLMLAIAQEADDSFLNNLVVADFGCGPRGSLVWISSADEKIGIDVLADSYRQAFPGLLEKHCMRYVSCSESSIPLPDASVDVIWTINALDHVQNLNIMCLELRRILKSGGILMGSFNLNNPPSKAEPQTLSEALLKSTLFQHMDILSWRVSRDPQNAAKYQAFYDGKLIPSEGKPAVLWAKASKR